ncbi:MAG: oxygen-independent coproporphyrinogen III oxidase [Methylococcales bacterium]|nr:oxygen-independent coproporphyrinogen III oxidase [Methylococcales bacterium]MBT7408382.1 oxygen-independent coproporphyrinogen III oxidase [Methylococcales bacterium]
MNQNVSEFDSELIKKYDVSGPRYTSYPTAKEFRADFSEKDYKHYLLQSNQDAKNLSLYFHLPFCDTICFFCACNKIATKDRTKVSPYLSRLLAEIELQSALIDSDRKVEQLHWGGGTPTFFSHEEMRSLMAKTKQCFNFLDNDEGEYSIEIDPREANAETIHVLREIGFNRISMGVQDFNEKVQKAVNRHQSIAETENIIKASREANFKSVSLDLIYGLPFQTADGFHDTLKKIINLDPDRISLFNYAHLPKLFKPQRRINETDLPSLSEKLAILQNSVEYLNEHGYVFIGMDHFAKEHDEMVLAQQKGLLHRNFQGYSTHADCDMISMGVTSIGKIGPIYSQNEHLMDDYIRKIDDGQLAIKKGLILTQDDLLRRDVIHQLMCHFSIDFSVIEKKYKIDFKQYFSQALESFLPMIDDDLLSINSSCIEISPKGRFLIRNIVMNFDKYMKQAPEGTFSKAI